jgi:hypothetical protein
MGNAKGQIDISIKMTMRYEYRINPLALNTIIAPLLLTAIASAISLGFVWEVLPWDQHAVVLPGIMKNRNEEKN